MAIAAIEKETYLLRGFWGASMSINAVRCLGSVVAVTGLVPAAYASAPITSTIWAKGSTVSGTCRATVDGKVVMDGPCSGLGHGSTVFVTAERDGCSVELTKTKAGVIGKILAYKDTCGDSDTAVNDHDVALGSFQPSGSCLRAKAASLCLSAGRP